METGERLDVAILGGGIAGLTVAYRLRSLAPELAIGLFEGSDRFGGKVLSERVETLEGDFIIEGAADAFLIQKPWARELIDELGLSHRLIPINQAAQPVTMLKNGRLIPLPEGVSMLAPTKLKPFLRSPLLSLSGKARTLCDLALPARTDDEDESLADFVRRRLGEEALDWLAEPLMAGIYNADPERMSILATFPNLRQLERKQPSLIRGMRAAKRTQNGAKRDPIFMSLQGGMVELGDALAEATSGKTHLNAQVERLTPHLQGGYSIEFANRPPVTARSVVLALPAANAARMLQPIAPEASSLLSELRTVSSGSISLAYRTAAITRPLPGYGLVVPAKSGGAFNAITVSSQKFDGRAPEGCSLLRIFYGGTRSPETMLLDDDALLQTMRSELRALLGIQSAPLFHRIYRWPAGSPQYDVGHIERIAAIDAAMPEHIVVTGSPYRGVGIPDIVRESTQSTQRLVEKHRAFAAHQSPLRSG